MPNHNKMHLEAAKNNYGININDIQSSGTKKQDNSKSAKEKNLSTDYQQNLQDYSITFYNDSHTPGFLNQIFKLSGALHESPEQPPELV